MPLRAYSTKAEHIQYLEKNRRVLHQMGKLAHDSVYPKSLMSEHLKFGKNFGFELVLKSIALSVVHCPFYKMI